MINLEVRNVSKKFANHCALNEVSLRLKKRVYLVCWVLMVLEKPR